MTSEDTPHALRPSSGAFSQLTKALGATKRGQQDEMFRYEISTFVTFICGLGWLAREVEISLDTLSLEQESLDETLGWATERRAVKFIQTKFA